VSEAGAKRVHVVEHDFSVSVAGQPFGFMDGMVYGGEDHGSHWSIIQVGDSLSIISPLPAVVGLLTFGLVVVGMLALVTVFTFRWKRKRAA
jgi:hypothetical protein